MTYFVMRLLWILSKMNKGLGLDWSGITPALLPVPGRGLPGLNAMSLCFLYFIFEVFE